MQFLSVCNRLLPKSLSARNYSVTPLGARSGLILQEMANQTARLNLNENVKVERPSELFFSNTRIESSWSVFIQDVIYQVLFYEMSIAS